MFLNTFCNADGAGGLGSGFDHVLKGVYDKSSCSNVHLLQSAKGEKTSIHFWRILTTSIVSQLKREIASISNDGFASMKLPVNLSSLRTRLLIQGNEVY